MPNGFVEIIKGLITEYEDKNSLAAELQFFQKCEDAICPIPRQGSSTGLVSQAKRFLQEYGNDPKAFEEALNTLLSDWVNGGLEKRTVFYCLVCRKHYPKAQEIQLDLETGNECCEHCFMKMSEYERMKLTLWYKTFLHYESPLSELVGKLDDHFVDIADWMGEIAKTMDEIDKQLHEIDQSLMQMG